MTVSERGTLRLYLPPNRVLLQVTVFVTTRGSLETLDVVLTGTRLPILLARPFSPRALCKKLANFSDDAITEFAALLATEQAPEARVRCG